MESIKLLLILYSDLNSHQKKSKLIRDVVLWKDHKSVSLRRIGLFQIQPIWMRMEIDTTYKPSNSNAGYTVQINSLSQWLGIFGTPGTIAYHLSLVRFLASLVYDQKTTLIIRKGYSNIWLPELNYTDLTLPRSAHRIHH